MAFVLTYLISGSLFIDNSPQFNARIFDTLQSSPGALFASISNIFQPKQSLDETLTAEIPRVSPPAGSSYAPIAKGVYASEPDANGERFIKIEKGTRLRIEEITLDDGNKVKVYVPID